MINCVLIVDDDYVSNFIAEKVLKSSGGVRMVTAVVDGKQALEYLKYQCADETDNYACPDLIFLDLNMPYFDGYEFLKKYKQQKNTANIPVVVLTATEPLEDKKKFLQEAGVTYLIKPLTAEKFNNVVEEIFHTL